MHLKIVDALLMKQSEIMKKMEENTASLENNDDMNGVSIFSEFMNQTSPGKLSKNVANGNTKSVGTVDGSNVTFLDSDESLDSLYIDINKEAEDMVENENESEVSK